MWTRRQAKRATDPGPNTSPPRENDEAPNDSTAAARPRVSVSLYRNNPPKLADTTASTSDTQRGRITPGATFDLSLDYLPAQELRVVSRTRDASIRSWHCSPDVTPLLDATAA